MISDILSGTYNPNKNQNNGYYSVNPAALGVLPFILREKSTSITNLMMNKIKLLINVKLINVNSGKERN